MKKAGNINMKKPKERFVKEYVCPGCNRTVTQKEMEIPIGPRKGEWITADYGCICEDLRLAKETKKTHKNMLGRKMLDVFKSHSLMNKSLQNATLENYEPTNDELIKAKHEVAQYINEFDGTANMLLHGTYGTGKSHLSISVTKELMKKGYECLFVSLPKLLTKIKNTYNGSGITEDKLLNLIQDVDLLVLDDVGAEQQTEWVNSKLFEIMDDRAGKATIYTTNLNSKELRNQIGERNFSRMMDNLKIIPMNGKDYRRKEF